MWVNRFYIQLFNNVIAAGKELLNSCFDTVLASSLDRQKGGRVRSSAGAVWRTAEVNETPPRDGGKAAAVLLFRSDASVRLLPAAEANNAGSFVCFFLGSHGKFSPSLVVFTPFFMGFCFEHFTIGEKENLCSTAHLAALDLIMWRHKILCERTVLRSCLLCTVG